MRRRSIVPFFVGSQRIASLQDLKKVIAENPEKLTVPLQDGRLERFLRGISNSYLECIDKDNPKESIEKLAERLGVEIQKDFTCEEVSVVTSVDELIKLIEEGEEEIELSKGEFVLDDELVLANPVKLIGQGKNDTHLKVKELLVASEGVVFENLICEADALLLIQKPEVVNTYFKFKSCASPDMTFIRGVGETLEPEKVRIEITEPIVLEGKKVFYENVDFVFKEEGSITFDNCECVIANCSFSLEEIEVDNEEEEELEELERDNEEEEDKRLILYRGSSNVKIEGCEFRGRCEIGVTAKDNSKLKIVNCRFIEIFGSGIEGRDNSQLEISKCEFSENENGVVLFGKSRGTIRDSIFDTNIVYGIWAEEDSKLEVIGCKFTSYYGGGLAIFLSGNNVATVKNSVFLENLEAVQSSAKLRVENCRFVENKSGIIVSHESQLEVIKCEFLKNENGVLLFHKSRGTVKDSIFDGNTKDGIVAMEDSKLEVVGCKFTNHVGEDGNEGKAIFLSKNSFGKVENCKFLKNSKGIVVIDSARLKVKNSRFTENSDTGIEGFLDSQLDVSKCKFLKNDLGVFLDHKSQITVKDSIFDENMSWGIMAVESSKLEMVDCNCDAIYYDGAHAEISNCMINELICISSGVNINSSTISLIKYDGYSKKPVVSNSTVGRWEDTSGCYITTATCLALGKGDDCYELNMFRWFRDNWLINQPDGKKLIEEYYETAPLIVDLINKRKDYKDIYFHLWEKYLNPCLKLLERGNFIEVKRIYTEMVKRLKDDFLRQGIKMKG